MRIKRVMESKTYIISCVVDVWGKQMYILEVKQDLPISVLSNYSKENRFYSILQATEDSFLYVI